MTHPIKTLVIVDDDSLFLQLCTRSIKRWGLVDTVLTFDGAEAALDYLGSGDERMHVDAILVDVNMPRLDGFDFLQNLARLYEGHASPPAVSMLSSSLDPRDECRAREFPLVRNYFEKPLDKTMLQQLAA